MNERKRISAKKRKKKAAQRPVPSPPGHRAAFDQLLDDAILGVPKKKKAD